MLNLTIIIDTGEAGEGAMKQMNLQEHGVVSHDQSKR